MAEVAGASPSRRVPPWAALAATCLGQFMVVLDATIVNVALPAMRRGLHLSATDLQWVVNAYLLTLGGLILLGGRPGVVVLAIDDERGQAGRDRSRQLIGAVGAGQQEPGQHEEVHRARAQGALLEERDDVLVGALGSGLRFMLVMPDLADHGR